MEEAKNRSNVSVSAMLEQWLQQRPELPVFEAGLVGVLLRVGKRLEQIGLESLKPFQLGWSEHDLLAALRRRGSPYAATPGELLDELFITSGALTACTNRLIDRGLVFRAKSKKDSRSRIIALTTDGFHFIDKVTTERFRLCEELMSVYSAEDKSKLFDLAEQFLKS